MAIPRHNAHMKIAKHVWDRARTCAILAGQSMTEFTEAALAAWCESQKEDDDGTTREVSVPADR